MPFIPRHDEPERIAQRIAHGMQFRGQPAPGNALRPASAAPFCASGVVIGAKDGGLDHQPFRVGIDRQSIENHLPDTRVRSLRPCWTAFLSILKLR
jgi:hypothetical protein